MLKANLRLFCPAGAKYVKPEIRKGILPSILAALMNARAATRAALKEVPADQPAQKAVLDSRQKALKLTANALYGFTGVPSVLTMRILLSAEVTPHCRSGSKGICQASIHHAQLFMWVHDHQIEFCAVRCPFSQDFRLTVLAVLVSALQHWCGRTQSDLLSFLT